MLAAKSFCTPATTLRGVYWYHHVRPFVRLSVPNFRISVLNFFFKFVIILPSIWTCVCDVFKLIRKKMKKLELFGFFGTFMYLVFIWTINCPEENSEIVHKFFFKSCLNVYYHRNLCLWYFVTLKTIVLMDNKVAGGVL